MDLEAQQEINRQLGSTERIRWVGRPKTGLTFQALDIFPTLFGMFWLAVIVPGFLGAWRSEDGPPFPILFMVPFLLVGLYLVIGRFVFDAWRRSRTFYGLTEQRVIILSGWFSTSIKSIPIKSLPDLSLKEKSNGSGTIIFGTGRFGSEIYARIYWPGMSAISAILSNGLGKVARNSRVSVVGLIWALM